MYIFLNNHENILEIITYSLNFCNWWWIWALFDEFLAVFHHFDYIWQFWKCCPIILFYFFLRFRCFVVWNIRFGCTMTFWTWPWSVPWPSVRAFPLSNGRWRWWRRFGRPRSWIFIDLWIRLRIQSVCWSIRWRCSRWCSRFNLLRLHINIVWSHSRQGRRSISWFLEKTLSIWIVIQSDSVTLVLREYESGLVQLLVISAWIRSMYIKSTVSRHYAGTS